MQHAQVVSKIKSKPHYLQNWPVIGFFDIHAQGGPTTGRLGYGSGLGKILSAGRPLGHAAATSGAARKLAGNHIEKRPDRTAIDFYDRTLTFRELHDLAARAAKGLQTLGVGPDVQVGLHLPNTPHFVICFFAILMAGGRVVNFSPLAAPRELKYQLMDSETRVMITLGLPMLYPQIATLKGTAKFETLVVCSIADFLPVPIAPVFGPAADRMGEAGREVDFAALIDNDGTFQRYPHGPLEDEVAVLQYTGGTTGEPKGAMLTHANLCAVLNIFNHWDQQSRSEEPDKALAVLPLFHIFGLTFIMLLVVANGAEMVLHIKFDPDRVLTDISHKKITVFLAVPTMYTALVNHPKAKEFDLSSVRRWVSGGAPLPMEVLQRFEALTGHSPKEGYGLTETAPLGTLQLTDRPARQGSVGLPAPHTLLEVVDLQTGRPGAANRGKRRNLLPGTAGHEGILEKAGSNQGSFPRRALSYRGHWLR